MKFQKFMRMAAQRNHEALQEVARAIREQTDYFREDDAKGNTESPVFTDDHEELPTDLPPHRIWGNAPPFNHELPEHEPPFVIPNDVVELMRVTPHQFVAPKRLSAGGRRMITNYSDDANCLLCVLKFGNPVHLIQMASLQED